MNFGSIMVEVWNEIKIRGIWHFWQEIIDPDGIHRALKTLNLQEGCTLDEIKKSYRELSRKWHPDKFRELQEKNEAEKKFMKIQQSYEILTKKSEKQEEL